MLVALEPDTSLCSFFHKKLEIAKNKSSPLVFLGLKADPIPVLHKLDLR